MGGGGGTPTFRVRDVDLIGGRQVGKAVEQLIDHRQDFSARGDKTKFHIRRDDIEDSGL